MTENKSTVAGSKKKTQSEYLQFGISKDLLNNIINIILSRKPVEKIVIFGSRAENNLKKTSDIDIAVFGRNWADKDINLTKDMLEENINTPLKFDLLNFYSLSKDKLKKDIIEKGKIIYGS